MPPLPAGLGRLLDFVLPPGCVVCGSWIPAREDVTGRTDRRPSEAREAPGGVIVCGRCRASLREASRPRCPRCHAPRGTGRDPGRDCFECRGWPVELVAARSAYVLIPPAVDLVHALKYEGWRELAGPMGAAIAEAARDLVSNLVVPVPTTPARVRRRGYNQAALLAEVVAGRLGLPVASAMRRAGAPRSQTTLSNEARRRNVAGAFTVVAPLPPKARVLLVDDVLTTGATASEAARALKAAGAEAVRVAAFARALPRYDDERAA